jgi:hypothetical protein
MDETNQLKITLDQLTRFDLEAIQFTLERIEGNGQTYGRGAARSDHMEIKNRLLEIDPNFDFTPYPNFSRRLEAEA